MGWKRFKYDVRYRIIVTFILLIIPTYVINLGINYMGMLHVKNEILNSNLSNAGFYARQLEYQIEFIRNQQIDFLNDSDLEKLSFQSESLGIVNEIESTEKVRERLSTIQNSIPYIVNSGVYILSYGKTISTRGGVSRLPNPEWDAIEKMMEGNNQRSVFFSRDTITIAFSANRGTLISYLEISINRFKQTLRQLVRQQDQSGIVITDDRNIPVLYEQSDQGLVTSLLNRIRLIDTNEQADYPAHADGKTYWITSTPLEILGWKLHTYISESELTGPLKKFTTWFLVLSAGSIVVIILFSISVNRMIHKPLYKLMQAFRRTEIDHLHSSISSQKDNEFDYLYKSFDKMLGKLNVSVQQIYEQKIALQQSELKQLQSQINPHFLYNGFYNIYRFCKSGDKETAATLAQKMASYYYFITRSGSDEVQLHKEYQNALDYCEIQRIRFSNRVDVHWDPLPNELRHIMVPRLIIQPIIENVFQHAFEQTLNDGALYISVRDETSGFRVRIEDNGTVLSDVLMDEMKNKMRHFSEMTEKTGMFNVARRIRIKYGHESGVDLSRSPFGGLRVEIRIPYSGGTTDV